MISYSVIVLLIATFIYFVSTNCPAGKFECKSDKKCIDIVRTCNGEEDCADGSDESLNCTNGCDINGTLWKPNSTIQTDEWWFRCSRSRWLLSGCVVHGVAYRVGQVYRAFTSRGAYWGKCEKVSREIIVRQPQGCIGKRGIQINDGQHFLVSEAFWAKCIVGKNSSIINGTKVILNDISWQIIGCNNGSDTPVGEGVEFPWFFESVTLWGVKLRCHIPSVTNLLPVLTPLACMVGVNHTGVWEIRRLKSDCYMIADDLVYFCRIYENKSAPPVLTSLQKDFSRTKFSLNITDNDPKTVKNLASEGYKPCYEIDTQLTSLINKKPQ